MVVSSGCERLSQHYLLGGLHTFSLVQTGISTKLNLFVVAFAMF